MPPGARPTASLPSWPETPGARPASSSATSLWAASLERYPGPRAGAQHWGWGVVCCGSTWVPGTEAVPGSASWPEHPRPRLATLAPSVALPLEEPPKVSQWTQHAPGWEMGTRPGGSHCQAFALAVLSASTPLPLILANSSLPFGAQLP